MPRWVFIRPCHISPYYDPEIQEPLGIQYLAARRREVGDAVLILDSALDSLDDQKLGRRTVSFQPDIIGISMTSAHEIESVKAIHAEFTRLQEKRTVLWVAGGNFVTSELHWAERLLPADFALVRFEGEQVLADLVEYRQSLPDEPESQRSPKRRLFIGAPIKNLDQNFFPDRPYARHVIQNGWAFNIQGSRGCCGACQHCASGGMSREFSSRWRGRSPDNIAEEMSFLQSSLGASSFNFVDEDFLGPNHQSLDRAHALAREIKMKRLEISFGIQVRPDSLDTNVIDALVEAGLAYVFLGIESDDAGHLKRWGRPHVPGIWEIVSHLRQRGVEINAGVILFHPHTVLWEVRRFAAKLHKLDLLDFQAVVNRMAAIPGSRIHGQAIKAGIINPEQPGQQDLPFIQSEVEPFYSQLLTALAPLGPPSMHAVCSLPSLTNRKIIEGDYPGAYHQLKQIIRTLNAAVAESLFAFLDIAERSMIPDGEVKRVRAKNLMTALQAVDSLVQGGFAASTSFLGEAIHKDTGL